MAVTAAVARNGAASYAARTDVVEYGPRRGLIILALITATLLEIIDTTIVNVALPNIQGNFGASLDQAAWIGTGYLIANVIVIPITPWLQRRFGRRQYYAASIAIFVVASMMCGLSGSLEQLIFWRIIQGLGGGGLISTSQATLRETFPPDKQGAAAGVFAMGVIVGPTIGPWLGGVLTDQLSWRWAFFVNLVPGIIAFTIVTTMLKNPEKPQKLPLDYVGLGLLAVGIGSLQYVLDQGQQKDWFSDQSVVTCMWLAIVGLIAFVFWELRSKKPVVDLSVLRYRSVAIGSVLGMVLGISLYGSVLILPQYVQGTLGWTATLSGQLLMFRAIPVMISTPFVAALAARGVVDARWFVAGGFVLIGISNFMLANVTTPISDFWTFFWSLALSGIGLSGIFVPLTVSVLGAVQQRDIPGASAFFNLSRQTGGSLAIALLVTLLARANATHHTELASAVVLHNGPVAAFVANDGGQGAERAAIDLNNIVTRQAAIVSFADTARLVGWISLLLSPCAFILKRPQIRGGIPAAE